MIMTGAPANLPVFESSDGLVPAVAQDAATGRVLMIAYMNREAWEETLRTGRAVYYSRSRGRLWRKGEVSGNVQQIRSVHVDCDGDAVLLKVDQFGGAACHEGYPSCFYREITRTGINIVEERVFDPGQVYRQELD
jgi:phosphoribosyl-AMP cyclohydrolase